MTREPYFINHPSNLLPENSTTVLLQNSKPLLFHTSLPVYQPTPLVELPNLAKSFGIGNIFLKDESFRFGLNAFKGLGASYAIFKILEEHPEIETFCTATDGNHGRAVAWSAGLFGKKAVVYVPKGTSPARIVAIKKEGAHVEEINENYDGTCAFAKKMSDKNKWQLVQDTSWEDYLEVPALIMSGYLTHFQELETSLHQLPKAKPEVVFLQAGVGSWPAAAVWYYNHRYGNNRPKLVIVEPTASSGILESFKKNERSMHCGNSQTIMGGLNCGIPSLSAWELIKDGVDLSIEIDDHLAEEAMRKLYFPKGNDPKITSGESGAGGFGGFLALMNDSRYEKAREHLKLNQNSTVLFYSTEGATDPENFKKIISEE